jgi:EXPERA (EXPanded EBP superfamily)
MLTFSPHFIPFSPSPLFLSLSLLNSLPHRFDSHINTQISINIGVSEENVKDLVWPPQFVYPYVHWWCDMADYGLAVNPMWMKALAWLSPFVYAPFYLFALYCFIAGKDYIRVPAFTFVGMMCTGLYVIFAESLWGDYVTPDPVLFTAAYGPYFVIPLLLAFRLRMEHPFTEAVSGKSN